MHKNWNKKSVLFSQKQTLCAQIETKFLWKNTKSIFLAHIFLNVDLTPSRTAVFLQLRFVRRRGEWLVRSARSAATRRVSTVSLIYVQAAHTPRMFTLVPRHSSAQKPETLAGLSIRSHGGYEWRSCSSDNRATTGSFDEKSKPRPDARSR